MDDVRLVAAHRIDPDRYRSYLLRLWREAPGGPWCCQVQCVGTGRKRRFAGLAEMFEFLVADAASAEAETRRDRENRCICDAGRGSGTRISLTRHT